MKCSYPLSGKAFTVDEEVTTGRAESEKKKVERKVVFKDEGKVFGVGFFTFAEPKEIK